ncbi:MAG: Gfo/Idh/MocA family oxidoreductase, partial [Armatimonadota bacterium]
MAARLNVGIIGTGIIGKSHLRRYADIEDAEVVAVCDIRADAARDAATQFGVPHVFVDYRKLLQMDEVDAVGRHR